MFHNKLQLFDALSYLLFFLIIARVDPSAADNFINMLFGPEAIHESYVYNGFTQDANPL